MLNKSINSHRMTVYFTFVFKHVRRYKVRWKDNFFISFMWSGNRMKNIFSWVGTVVDWYVRKSKKIFKFYVFNHNNKMYKKKQIMTMESKTNNNIFAQKNFENEKFNWWRNFIIITTAKYDDLYLILSFRNDDKFIAPHNTIKVINM